MTFGVAGNASATPVDPDIPTESYPMPTDPVTVPPTVVKPLPATGSDSTGTWIKIGGATVLAGGLLVAATSRRRNHEQAEA
ncbi:LPXTG cell wall anchor domain-containing protein [Ilumatobacter sp.]|uniref:LPXTG cell wall anchor domain-containing protein n=1 Tax=Ilumatobacter sp. TaxID=1967498 RepID=UPI003C46D37F